MCPPLDGTVGAPPLPVLTTKDPRIIQRWLEEHVSSSSDSEYSILGFDIESIAKPPWKPERASLPDGPATIQLSTPSSCIIVPLSRCGDGSAAHAPEILREVMNDPRIIKAGVGIDDDALELYRWSKESCLEEDATTITTASKATKKDNHNHSSFANENNEVDDDVSPLWEMTSRFDLGCILPNKNPSRRSGIRELAEKILGVQVPKSKKLSMSNWGKRHLSLEQISYAARDAWVSAAIVERLQQEGDDSVFGAAALMEMEFMRGQRCMEEMDERASARKEAKLELKEIVARQRAEAEEGLGIDEDDVVRKQELYFLLDKYRPDQPPTFDEDAFTLQLF